MSRRLVVPMRPMIKLERAHCHMERELAEGTAREGHLVA
jgi:hypothetical protein